MECAVRDVLDHDGRIVGYVRGLKDGLRNSTSVCIVKHERIERRERNFVDLYGG